MIFGSYCHQPSEEERDVNNICTSKEQSPGNLCVNEMPHRRLSNYDFWQLLSPFSPDTNRGLTHELVKFESRGVVKGVHACKERK